MSAVVRRSLHVFDCLSSQYILSTVLQVAMFANADFHREHGDDAAFSCIFGFYIWFHGWAKNGEWGLFPGKFAAEFLM